MHLSGKRCKSNPFEQSGISNPIGLKAKMADTKAFMLYDKKAQCSRYKVMNSSSGSNTLTSKSYACMGRRKTLHTSS